MKDIETGLTDQDMVALEQSLATMNNILSFRKNLTEKQRSAAHTIGPRRLDFTLKAFDYAKMYPQLLTGTRSLPNFIRVHSDFMRLAPLLRKLRILTQSIDDTVLLIGANLYDYSRSFYRSAQGAINDEIPGLTTVLDELSAQFAAQGGDGPEEDTNLKTPGSEQQDPNANLKTPGDQQDPNANQDGGVAA